jgi:hypothetical protein
MARMWVPSGVDASALAVAGGLAPTLVAGPTINVAAGGCWLDGHYAEIANPSSVPATANGLLVVRFTPADNHAELVYRDAATVPVQTLTTWELPIASMAAGVMTDARVFAKQGRDAGQRPAVLLRNTIGIAIPHNALTAVIFQTSNSNEYIDTDNMHDPTAFASRITFRTGGDYLLTGSAQWVGNVTGQRVLLFRNEAAATISSDRRPGLAASGAGVPSCSADCSICTPWNVNAGQWVELVAFQDSGVTLNLNVVMFGATAMVF